MSTNRNTNSDERQMFNFRVDPGQLGRFREVAAANHRTVSQALRLLMDQYIDDADGLERAA